MAYNLEPRTIKENLLGLIGKNPHAEPRPANTREECFLADIAENGGGGGGLPPYTSADKGKVLTVGEAEGQTVIVVPEQSGTISAITYDMESTAYGAVLDGVDTSSLANGQSVTFEVAIGPNSNTATLYYLADTTVLVTALDETGDTFVFLAEVDGQNKWIFDFYDSSIVGLSYKVTASVPAVAPYWIANDALIVEITDDSGNYGIEIAGLPPIIKLINDTIYKAFSDNRPIIVYLNNNIVPATIHVTTLQAVEISIMSIDIKDDLLSYLILSLSPGQIPLDPWELTVSNVSYTLGVNRVERELYTYSR